MGGGNSYKGFPVPNPTISYWQLPTHRIAEHRSTASLPTSKVFDYVIVGSGISGASIAYKLLTRNPSTSILMLEARTAASGASGRNGGHCRAGWWKDFKQIAEQFGEDEALKFETLEEGTVQDIEDFVAEHEVDCDFQDIETADLCANENQWLEALKVKSFREQLLQRKPESKSLVERTFRHGQEARDHTGIPGIAGAITYTAHTLNPYLLVCKLLELSLEKGLNLQTNTLVTSLNQNTSPHSAETWEVHTERGTVLATQVILATNAYTNALHRGLAATGYLTPSRRQVTAIRPGSNASRIPSLNGSVAIDEPKARSAYLFRRAAGLRGEGDIIRGGATGLSKNREMGITDDSTVNPDIAEYLHHASSRLFSPENWGTDGAVLRDWTGITCYTPDSFPLVGQVPSEKGLWMSVGMNGHGMAFAFRCAEALVESIYTGSEPEWLPRMFRLKRAWQSNEK